MAAVSGRCLLSGKRLSGGFCKSTGGSVADAWAPIQERPAGPGHPLTRSCMARRSSLRWPPNASLSSPEAGAASATSTARRLAKDGCAIAVLDVNRTAGEAVAEAVAKRAFRALRPSAHGVRCQGRGRGGGARRAGIRPRTCSSPGRPRPQCQVDHGHGHGRPRPHVAGQLQRTVMLAAPSAGR